MKRNCEIPSSKRKIAIEEFITLQFVFHSKHRDK